MTTDSAAGSKHREGGRPAAGSFQIPDLEGALCTEVDTGDLFFPNQGGSTTAAKQICAACPVRLACLQWALDNYEQYGIWGGLTERERRRLRVVNTIRANVVTCHGPGCTSQVTRGPQSRALYCSRACRQAAWRERRPAA